MLVKSCRGEIINLELIKEFKLISNELIIREGDKLRKFTLTEESTDLLTQYLEEHVK